MSNNYGGMSGSTIDINSFNGISGDSKDLNNNF
jgi:hypothetical protein